MVAKVDHCQPSNCYCRSGRHLMTSKTTSSDNLIRLMTGTLRGNLAEFSTALTPGRSRRSGTPRTPPWTRLTPWSASCTRCALAW